MNLGLKGKTALVTGASTGGPPGGALDKFGPGEWREQYEALFESVLRLSAAFAPEMKNRGWRRKPV